MRTVNGENKDGVPETCTTREMSLRDVEGGWVTPTAPGSSLRTRPSKREKREAWEESPRRKLWVESTKRVEIGVCPHSTTRACYQESRSVESDSRDL